MARKKSKRKDDDDDDRRSSRREEADDAPPKTRSDAYVGLLAVSLVALITGARCCMYLDADELAKQTDPDSRAVACLDDGLALPKSVAPGKS